MPQTITAMPGGIPTPHVTSDFQPSAFIAPRFAYIVRRISDATAATTQFAQRDTRKADMHSWHRHIGRHRAHVKLPVATCMQ
jgi:hypothetical protein